MCKYQTECFDYKKQKLLQFRCEEKTVKDGYCSFHHPQYWEENADAVANEFYKKVESAMKADEGLFCIGYHLPSIYLNNKKIAKPVHFNKSIFHGKVHFTFVEFSEGVDFTATTFMQEADFTETRFMKTADFSEAAFQEADFGGATLQEANFGDATFVKDASFREAILMDEASYCGTKFMKGADFFSARFQKAYFAKTQFRELVFFAQATFTQKAIFFQTAFGGEGIFFLAKFMGSADFTALKRIQGVDQTADDPVLFFQSAAFENPEKVCFDEFDISNTSFLYTDVSHIDIGERIHWKANKKLLDEKLANGAELPYKITTARESIMVPLYTSTPTKGEITHEVVATVYRRLRQNLEAKLRYTEAGRFFMAEMEEKRKNVKTKNRILKWFRTNVFSALAWYKYFSNYGESYRRTVLWIVFTPPLAALLATLIQTAPSHLSQFAVNFQRYLHDYLFAFFQLKTDNAAELATRILSLLLMGQLYIALRRQFERKYKSLQ